MKVIAQDSLNLIEELADVFLASRKDSKETSQMIVPFVGAGASKPATIPTGWELKQEIYTELIKQVPNADYLFEKEAMEHFGVGKLNADSLSLFQFASIISCLGFGRELIDKVITHSIGKATHRPLCYELLAHLAKHGFIRFFVSLNFDRLLDEALKDELPSTKTICTSDDVPGQYASDQQEPSCWIFKPFGCLSTGKYSLRPVELETYGQNSIWAYLKSKLGGNKIILVLIGYAAAEKAFVKLIDKLIEDGITYEIYVIDRADKISSLLMTYNSKHIKCDADDAFSVLIEIMQQNAKLYWNPIARHIILSKFVKYKHLYNDNMRFKLEVILQAVKSRGFFTVNSVSRIPRIQKYSIHAKSKLLNLQHMKVLHFQGSKENYYLDDNLNNVAVKLLKMLKNKKPNFTYWNVKKIGDKFTAELISVQAIKYLVSLFESIQTGPEIEIDDSGFAAANWLFRAPVELRTQKELIEKTHKMFERFLHNNKSIELLGVWSTGEWLFYETKYRDLLLKKLENNKANIKIIISDKGYSKKDPGKNFILTSTYLISEEIRKNLSEKTLRKKLGGKLTVFRMNWWQLNRIFTLIKQTDKPISEGIYMRRRLSTPLVSPVHVKDKDDCKLLEDIFNRYLEKDSTRMIFPDDGS